MITIPLFMPIVSAFNINPTWWAVVMLLAIAIGPVTPPFGLDMFVLNGVTPPDVSLRDIYRAALPFTAITLLVLVLIMAVPALSLWLPSVTR